jgi:hypothetical protein
MSFYEKWMDRCIEERMININGRLIAVKFNAPVPTAWSCRIWFCGPHQASGETAQEARRNAERMAQRIAQLWREEDL